MRNTLRLIAVILAVLLLLTGCVRDVSDNKDEPIGSDNNPVEQQDDDREKGDKVIDLYINDSLIDVTWENNEAVEALKEKLEEKDVVINMSMYGGFEQVGPFGFSLPRSDSQMTTSSGDMVLYSGNQLVLFYGSNSWSYTKLGRMNLSQPELTDLLGNGNVTITLSLSAK